MDKFVIRKPRNSPSSSPKKKGSYLKQATIESLKGVVVIEELERARVVLERSDTSSELKVDTLQHLKRKRPAKEVLIKTQLGKTVHKLCKSKDADVAEAAKEVYSLWKEHVLSKVNRPLIEVRCDAKTQSFRNTARRMLLDALKKSEGEEYSGAQKEPQREKTEKNEGKCTEKTVENNKKKMCEGTSDSIEVLAEYIERDVYQATRRLVSNAYRRTIRKLVFTLRHQCDVRQSVISSTLPVAELVKQHLKS
ncbi:transcription elongation factor A N-terminal and central domain-containing protein 2 [Procambarus clarkii]|uniref:transcription elongation factor A N-terminal and central domain-containing protein 2 n=1 Tax=Procambarus clarkii TaxID=6728 RepID=UPI001E675E28|nr:transcription elongation factor A N-terminal and central domain-containing protein 2-like [Procambarus clarkii]XP_045595470.1 transcription elongation factor A N-terminal and central domain-containing protein 2-like [Procambarus clarkii]XP_045595471.1 transcription elongation factor A N-terminal and central domain-containing protein 2-like [Procambarus clarkii]